MTSLTPSNIPAQSPSLIYGVARLLSGIFSPLLMATYGVALALSLSFLVLIPFSLKLTVLLVVLVATTAVPLIAIFLLSKFKIVKDPSLVNRADRTWPYILETACFIGVAIYLYAINAPIWLSLFMLGGAAALIILTIVNHWWKISGHATGMGGLCALVFYLMISGNTLFNLQWVFLACILLAGMVATARLLLGRHTLMQVAAGFLNGFACVLLPALIATPAHV